MMVKGVLKMKNKKNKGMKQKNQIIISNINQNNFIILYLILEFFS